MVNCQWNKKTCQRTCDVDLADKKSPVAKSIEEVLKKGGFEMKLYKDNLNYQDC